MDIKKSLEVLKDLRDTAAAYQEFGVKELDAAALDFAISYIENTAQEGQVQVPVFKDSKVKAGKISVLDGNGDIVGNIGTTEVKFKHYKMKLVISNYVEDKFIEIITQFIKENGLTMNNVKDAIDKVRSYMENNATINDK